MNKMTNTERDKYVEYVNNTLLERYKQSTIKSEADFIAGAACIFAVMDSMDKLPAKWVFNILRGNPVLDEISQDQFDAIHGLDKPQYYDEDDEPYDMTRDATGQGFDDHNIELDEPNVQQG